MNALQGYVLFSSDRGGMRIEYAKNKMGEVSNTQITIPVSVTSALNHQIWIKKVRDNLIIVA